MNIQFTFKNESSKGEYMVFHSTNFPDNIVFQKGDDIWICDFKSFLNKGELYEPEEGLKCADLDDTSGICEVLEITHGYDEKIGYILLLTVECR